MSLASAGGYAAGLLTQTLSSLMSSLENSQASSSSSSASATSSAGISTQAFANSMPSITGTAAPTSNSLTGSSTPNLSNQVLGALLQAQELGSSQFGSGAGPQSAQGGQPGTQSGGFNTDSLNQLVQNIEQDAGALGSELGSNGLGSLGGLTGGGGNMFWSAPAGLTSAAF